MDINEKFCPTCKNKNERGAIVCIYCGAPLDTHHSSSVLTTRNAEISKIRTAKLASRSIDDSLIPEDGIAIYSEGMAKPAYLHFERELILGRKGLDADGTSDGSILNLSELGGYQMGISRRHAVIRRTEDGYEVIDLGSTNGSWLNDMRLVPNKPYPLSSGSQLQFGKMRLLILHYSVSRAKQ